MTVKAGQKCTAIRRAIVPRKHLAAVTERLRARLAKVVVGDPAVEGVTMGALASHEQQRDVAERVAQLARKGNTVLFGADRRLRAARHRHRPGRVLLAHAAAVRAPGHAIRGARRRGRWPGQHR